MGVLAAVGSVAVVTAVIYGLRELVPVVSTGVVYMLAVLFVSSYWGLWLGLLTALLSAAALNFFHIPPTGGFTIAEGENWVALGVFFIAAVAISGLAGAARARAEEAERRRARGRPDRRDGAPAARRRRSSTSRCAPRDSAWPPRSDSPRCRSSWPGPTRPAPPRAAAARGRLAGGDGDGAA